MNCSPRQCNVLSSAIPGHRPQTLLNTSGSLAMGTSNTSLWPTAPLSRLSPLHKRDYTSSHAVSSPPPKLHLTLSIPALKQWCIRQRSWSTPWCRTGFTGKRLKPDHHSSLAAAVTQVRGAFLISPIIDSPFEFIFSLDDPCLSVTSSSCSCQCHGFPHSDKVRNSHHKSQ